MRNKRWLSQDGKQSNSCMFVSIAWLSQGLPAGGWWEDGVQRLCTGRPEGGAREDRKGRAGSRAQEPESRPALCFTKRSFIAALPQ